MSVNSLNLLIIILFLVLNQGCSGTTLFTDLTSVSSTPTPTPAPWSNIKQTGVSLATLSGAGVAADGLGNIYVTGSTNTSLTTGPGPASLSDYFLYVSKYNSSGALKFTLQNGISGTTTYGAAITTDSSNNFYVSGYTNGDLVHGAGASTGLQDLYITKYDSSGTRQFISQYGVLGRSTQCNGVAVDLSGNIYVAGNTSGNLVTDTGPSTGNSGPCGGPCTDAYVTKFNSSGVYQSTKQVGLINNVTTGFTDNVDSSGNSYLVGYTTANLVNSTSLEANPVNLGRTIDSFVIKYSSLGVAQTPKQLGFAGTITYGLGVAADSAGYFYVVGTSGANLNTNAALTGGRSDCFIAKYDSSGTLQFIKEIGVPTFKTYCVSVTTDASNHIFVSGYTGGNLVTGSGASTGTADYFIAKFDSSGTQQFISQNGVTGGTTSKALGIVLDSGGNIFTTGITTGNLVTGSGSSTGVQDAFISKYNSSGVQQ